MMYSEYCRTDVSLRDYQQEAKRKIFRNWDLVDNVMYQMPTGTGKTRLFTSIIRDISVGSILAQKKANILIIAHRSELIEQISESLTKYRVKHGIISGAFKDKRDLLQSIQVASIQTITHHSNYETAHNFDADFMIIDEAHHSTAESYVKLWHYYPNAKKLGVTATPWRMDGTGFRNLFDVLITSMSIKEFLKKGWLSPYEYYSVSNKSEIYKQVSEIKEFGVDGDYKQEMLERIVDISRIRAQLLDSYLKFAKGKKGIIYSISREHSRNICAQYSSIGIRIRDIDSSIPIERRRKIVHDFKEGNVDIVVNVDIFSEGFDCPDLEFVQLARPTRSLVKYIQQIGRGLRKNGDKKCVILDNVGLYNQFGLPDEDRPWEDYFNGVDKQIIGSNEKMHRTVRIDNIGEKANDLMEGSDMMSLIQSFENQDIQQTQIEEPHNSINHTNETVITVSPIIFFKYNVVETNRGYYFVNQKSNAKQILCAHLNRLPSISLKVIKMPDAFKCYVVMSSFNRNEKPSPSDSIIGYIYKVGRILKFAKRIGIEEIPITI